MNKFIAIAALAAALTGCATAPTNLPPVDVSKMENGKVLTAAEINSAVRGRQMTGTVTTGAGYVVPRVLYVYEADGTLHGANPNDWDKGKWSVNQSNELCNTWTRWQSGCVKVTVRSGKLHLLNAATGGQYQQQ